MVFWEHEEHEVAYGWLRAVKMWPGNGVLGTRRTRSGSRLAPRVQNVVWEWCSGNGFLRSPKNSRKDSEGFFGLPDLSGSPVRIPPRPPWG
eukprot:3368572-Pyramimonas_sp.AAC.1